MFAAILIMLTEKFGLALQLSFEIHRHQVRKTSNIPFYAHLMSVAALVLENGGTETEAIAALFHDAAEDAGGVATLEQIRGFFGSEVADIIELCSDSLVEDYNNKAPWMERKLHTINMLKSWDSNPEKQTDAQSGAIRVMLADKVHNARSTFNDYLVRGNDAFDCFKTGKAGTLWYLSSMCSELQRLSDYDSLSLELSEIIEKMSRQSISEIIESNRAKLDANMSMYIP